MEADKLNSDPKELMDLARTGDKVAYGKLYELYFVPVFRYIYLRVKNKEEANDLTQTVFLKVFGALSSFKDQGKSPLAYFFAVARNTVIDYWRTRKNNIQIDDPKSFTQNIVKEDDNPQKIYQEKETQLVISKAINQLTDTQQEVIILKFINNLSNKEIACLLEKSEEAIRQIQCRALKSIRDYLKKQEYYE